MKLSITLKDRLLTGALASVLKLDELSVYDAIILKGLFDSFALKPDEIEKYKIVEENGTTSWDSQIKHKFDHEFTERQLSALIECIKASTMGGLKITQIPEYTLKLITHTDGNTSNHKNLDQEGSSLRRQRGN